MKAFLDFHLKHRWLVLAGVLGIVAAGLWALSHIPIDAFPDLTNNQATIVTEAPGMAPSEVEKLVTFPIETAVMGLPRAQQVRSISKLGLSIVTVVFEDSVNIYLARQLLSERLLEVRSRIPEGLQPTLGPIATAFGEIFQYTVEGESYSPMELKTLHDWDIKYQLRAVPGVSEINTWGGFTQQYQVVVEPYRIRSYGLTLHDIYERLRDNNNNFGAGFIEHGSEQYTIRGLGRVQSIRDLEEIVVSSHRGTPVYLRDVAQVQIGWLPRQGAVTRDGKGETVSGMVIMLRGENGKEVNARVQSKLEEIGRSLPPGVRISPFYDQATVIDRTIRTVRNNLLEGGALVVVVLFLFLGNLRAALIVAAVIPLSMFFGFLGMMIFGISANLMSLGAIDFGLIVDGSVVMMENCVRRLQGKKDLSVSSTLSEILAAAHEVARPIVFAIAIIVAVYIPILALEGLEGRMFRPMAVTVCSALLGSLVLALTTVPAAASLAFQKGVRQHRQKWFDRVQNAYVRLLPTLIQNRKKVVAAALCLVTLAVGSLMFIGTEFMPRLDEGSILIETFKLPSISLSESVAISTEIEKILLTFEEVSGVVTKIGRPDLATEAMGIYQGDVYVQLKPLPEWTTTGSKEALIEKIAAQLDRLPGVTYSFTQPMAMRLDEVVSGVKADVAVKIFGEDSDILNQKADEVLRVLTTIPGAADLRKEVSTGAAEWQIHIDRSALARFGLNVSDLQDLIQTAVAGQVVTEYFEGQKRFGIALRLPAGYRQGLEALDSLQLAAPGGEIVLLGQVARIQEVESPEMINREDGQRRIVVQANVRGRDLGSFVEEARARIRDQVGLPSGYYYSWGGQFENQQRAMARLSVAVPAAILIIFALLFASFGSVRQSLLILLNVPFAAVGGIAALWLRGINLNLSAAVGFIALFGVAVLNGVVLVSYINRLLEKGMSPTDAIVKGAATRLRPVLMTALVASLGFVPMATATTAGAEVQRPLATVVIGGLVTSTLLTLVVLPSLFSLCCGKEADPGVKSQRPSSALAVDRGPASPQ